jgi:hypothetical protein
MLSTENEKVKWLRVDVGFEAETNYLLRSDFETAGKGKGGGTLLKDHMDKHIFFVKHTRRKNFFQFQ